ncbi:hypothetical protein Tco_1232125 [Tanacetum coccineum]
MTYPCHWFSEQVGLAGDMGSINDVLIPLVVHGKEFEQNLIQPFDEPEQIFHSNLKLFNTSSLDYLNSPEFDLFSKYEEQSEGEVFETMTKPTMEEYMTKTREELRDNTFSGLDNEDANEHIEKVLEIVDLFHIPNITQDQVMLRAFPMSLTRASSCWLRNEHARLITTLETLKFYKGLDVPTRQFLDSKGAIPSMKAADAKKAI